MEKQDIRKVLSVLPSVDYVMRLPETEQLIDRYSRQLTTEAVREALNELREAIKTGQNDSNVVTNKAELTVVVVQRAEQKLTALFAPSLRKVINATGVILHTNLGRAPLPEVARQNLARVTDGYANLEIDLPEGVRGERLSHVDELLCRLTGAEMSAVVNNNAAAVLLSLNTLALGKEVIVSRGQLIEIGGSFRLPEVMQRSGAIMVEVGTTNKTRASDYEAAITENTGAILVAHTSNYRVLGFTEEAELEEVAEIAHRHGLPLIHDLGGGILLDFRRFGLPHEPIVQESLSAGADVVTFSGDKVLGGPQSGIIVGKAKYLRRIRKNPLMRALRCDKMVFAALEPTLKLFLNEERLLQEHPTFRMLTEPVEAVQRRAEAFLALIADLEVVAAEVVESFGQAGSGTLPLEKIPSRAVRLRHKQLPAAELATRLRAAEPPVIPYVREEAVYLDFRTVREDEVEELVRVVRGAVTNG